MNAIISAAVGGALALMALVGGVSAYNGDPEGVSSSQLYTYADE